MELEQTQAPLIEQFMKQAYTLKGSPLANLIVEATSHPSLFGFSEILSVPNVLELKGTENSASLEVLRLFAHGTWRDYKSNASLLPELVPGQIVKLKQLTVLTLAQSNKDISYDQLQQELELSTIRELEDFLIDECIYAGIVQGKLDHLRRCVKVQFAVGRDLTHGQLGSMIERLENWLATSDNLVSLIEEKVQWTSEMCEKDSIHQKEVEAMVEKGRESGRYKAWISSETYKNFASGEDAGPSVPFPQRPRRRPRFS